MTQADTYSRLREKIREFNRSRDWGQFHDPKNLALSLVLESTEVLELFQWTQDNQLQQGKEDQIRDELADVFYWVIMLADKYDVDLLAALESKMEKNELKYPIEKAKGTSSKYTEL